MPRCVLMDVFLHLVIQKEHHRLSCRSYPVACSECGKEGIGRERVRFSSIGKRNKSHRLFLFLFSYLFFSLFFFGWGESS